MDFNEEDIDLDSYIEPSQFREKLNILIQQLPSILEDFKKYFIFYNKNPEYDEYQQMFENIKLNLNEINSNLFVLSNDVENATENLNKKLFALNILINKERKKNKVLKNKLGIIEDKSNTSHELISNYEEIYNSYYLRNWSLFFSIIIVMLTIKNIYNKS
jgi:galactitol-specific phosphotransferase system IIB component